MQPHHDRQGALFLARKTRQVHVGEHVTAVMMVLAVRDHETDFMQLRGPAEQAALAFQQPLVLDLPEQFERGFAHPSTLFDVDVVAFHHFQYGHRAAVLEHFTADEVVQHALAQGTVGYAHEFEFQRVENRRHHRYPAREYRASFVAEPLDFELARLARLDDALDQLLQACARYAGFAPFVFAQHVGDRARGSGGADDILCLQPLQSGNTGFQFELGVEDGAAHETMIVKALGEETLAAADTTHVKAFQVNGLAAVTDDDLGTAAADVHNHAPSAVALQGLCGAEVDQARLLDTGNDFDGKSERLFGARDEVVRIGRLAQRVGADHAYVVGFESAQAFTEACETGEGALAGFLGEQVVLVQTGGQAHHVALAVDDRHGVFFLARDDEVKTVRTEVDSGELLVVRGLGHVSTTMLPTCFLAMKASCASPRSASGKLCASNGCSRSCSIRLTRRCMVPGGTMVAPVSCRSLYTSWRRSNSTMGPAIEPELE